MNKKEKEIKLECLTNGGVVEGHYTTDYYHDDIVRSYPDNYNDAAVIKNSLDKKDDN